MNKTKFRNLFIDIKHSKCVSFGYCCITALHVCACLCVCERARLCLLVCYRYHFTLQVIGSIPRPLLNHNILLTHSTFCLKANILNLNYLFCWDWKWALLCVFHYSSNPNSTSASWDGTVGAGCYIRFILNVGTFLHSLLQTSALHKCVTSDIHICTTVQSKLCNGKIMP